MPRSGGVTRRSGDRMPEKGLHSHTQDALGHALSGIDRQGRSQRRQSAGVQEPPRTLISERVDG